MGWTPQRLPITMQPGDGEALDSWLEAYARRLRVCSSDLLDHLGLGSARLANMVTLLTPNERDILAGTIGVDPQRLSAMTLQRFDGIAVAIDHTRRTLVHPPAWRRATGSRFCPACLRDTAGRWQLTWRLPWSFACPIHHCLLVDYCLRCGRRPSPHRRGTGEATAPGTCTAPAGSATRRWRFPLCGHDLTATPAASLPSGGVVLAAHQQIQRMIASAAAEPDRREAGHRSLAELHVLAYKGLAALHPNRDVPKPVKQIIAQCGGSIPAPRRALDSFDAHTIAIAATIATTAHSSDPAADTTLEWIIHSERERRTPAHPGVLLRPWREANPNLRTRILATLDEHLTIHDRLAYGTANPAPRRCSTSPADPARRATSLPPMLWPAWSIRLIPAKAAPTGLAGTRAALAALTLIPDTHLSYQQALEQLGSYAPRNAVRSLLTNLAPHQATAVVRLLTQLAHTLDANPAPIDYDRRRGLLTAGATINPAAYATFAARQGWRPPSPLQLRILDHHLAITLTGAHRPPSDPRRPNAVDLWNPLLFTLPTTVREFVNSHARTVLRSHGISEPLTWQPGTPDDPDADWPGLNPDAIDTEQLACAIHEHAYHRCAAARVSDATGLHGAHLQLATQTLMLNMPEEQWNDLADEPNLDITDPARLRHLYQDQILTLHEIAVLTLTSEPEVCRILAEAGTPHQPRRPRRANIPRAWFEQHYISTGKSLQQVASETGYSRNTLSKYARQHGIPTSRSASPAPSPNENT